MRVSILFISILRLIRTPIRMSLPRAERRGEPVAIPRLHTWSWADAAETYHQFIAAANSSTLSSSTPSRNSFSNQKNGFSAGEHLAVFSNYCLARIFSIRYIGLDTLIRYIDDSLSLTYEKHTTVLYQPVSECSHLSPCRCGGRATTCAHASG